MDNREEYKGLCSSCRSTSTCTFPKTSAQPILQCEEFDGSSASPPDALLKSSLSSPASRPAEDLTMLMGLCRGCERAMTCTYPKTEGGVWHCEEFQ